MREIPDTSETSQFLEKREVRRFIENREVREESLPLILKLSEFPKDDIISFHNFFTLNTENSLRELERGIETAKLENRTERQSLYELLRDFLKAYDWDTANNLIRILEDI